jgi:N-acetylglutamate synthase-like GNAT family acetyltransferase
LEKKLNKVLCCSKRWYKEFGPKELHWYLPCVGFCPDSNDKGMGRDLVEKVGEPADEVGMPCYLECGTSNRGFYEKMGYRVLASKHVEDPVDSKRDTMDLLVMLRSSTRPYAIGREPQAII